MNFAPALLVDGYVVGTVLMAAVDGKLTARVPVVVGVAASPEVMVLTLTKPASEFEVPVAAPFWTL